MWYYISVCYTVTHCCQPYYDYVIGWCLEELFLGHTRVLTDYNYPTNMSNAQRIGSDLRFEVYSGLGIGGQ